MQFDPTIEWRDGLVRLIDQTQLPEKAAYLECRDVRSLWRAIKRLSVRGAPALGVAAAFGVLLGIKGLRGQNRLIFDRKVVDVADYIATSRPTAVNLFSALERMKSVLEAFPDDSVDAVKDRLHQTAMDLYEEDRVICRRMGRHGSRLIKNNSAIMTVCNAGALATVDYGTALGVMYAAKEKGKRFDVYACETRPLLQGARLTAWELMRQKIPVTLICDNMAATVMKQGKVSAIFTGADRIAANGDAANKIGTYNLAVLARHHHIPFYIVAPKTTFDLSIRSGKEIPIEERSSDEVTSFGRRPTAPRGVSVYNPAFDVTESRLIKGIVTEYGIISPPSRANIKKMLNGPHRKEKAII